MTDHPDVALAKKHQERIARINASREAESEPDLRQAVRDLAEIVGSGILAHLIGGTIQERRRDPRNEGARENEMILRQMQDDVREIARRLA